MNKKLVFYCYLIMTPILLLISILLFVSNYRNSMTEQNAMHSQSVQSLGDSIDVLQTEMINLCTYISINDEIRQILKAGNAVELNKDAQLWLHHAPMKMIQDMIALNGSIKTIAIYPENGVNPYLRCIDASSFVGNIQDIRKTDNYKRAIAEEGKILWRRASKNDSEIYLANRTDKIILYREIYTISKQEKLGYLVIGATADKFTDLCENLLQNKEEGILILSAEGAELARSGEVEEDLASCLLDSRFIKEGYQAHTTSFTYGKNTVFTYQDKKNSAIICKIVPMTKLGSRVYDIAFGPMVLLLGFLAGLFPILIFVSNIVSKPLKNVCVAMEQFRQGDFDQRVTVMSNDEVGQVASGFNQMVSEIKELIDTNYVMALNEKESELAALQAQINPHFLYNTLDSLYWQVIETGNEEIAEDIFALSQLFRLVLGQGKGITTVRQEKELISRYLQIQTMRFSKKLEIKIVMDESILEVEIPKLILQPFVENAIVHGFENVGSSCCIRITGEKESGKIVFKIIDTGIGMTKEQLDAIWNVEESKRYKSQRIGRYAIKNVRERLELKYHDDFELRIESEQGIGTAVTVVIPLKEGEK